MCVCLYVCMHNQSVGYTPIARMARIKMTSLSEAKERLAATTTCCRWPSQHSLSNFVAVGRGGLQDVIHGLSKESATMKRVFAFAGGLTSSFICFNAIDGIFSWSSDDGAKFSRGKLFQARSQCVNAAAKREGLVCFCLFLDLNFGKLYFVRGNCS